MFTRWLTISVAMLFSVASAMAQDTNSGGALGGLLQGLARGRQIKQQEQLNKAQEDLLREQAERIRLQNEQTRTQNEAMVRANAISQQFDSALAKVRQRFADYDLFASESTKLMTALDPNSPGFSLEHYLEGMYFIAKYATFSTVASPSPAGLLVREPAFYTVPMPVRISLLRAVEPQARMLPDSDVETIINGIAAKLNIQQPDPK